LGSFWVRFLFEDSYFVRVYGKNWVRLEKKMFNHEAHEAHEGILGGLIF
jgi:hypothetical protein